MVIFVLLLRQFIILQKIHPNFPYIKVLFIVRIAVKKGDERMTRTGSNIYKRKDGRWEARYIKYYDMNGKAKYGYLYARTYTEVKRKLCDAYSKCELHTIKDEALLEHVTQKWLEANRMKVKESTYAHYYHLCSRHILPDLGKYPISKISTQLMEKYIQDLLTSGRLDGKGGLSSKTVSDIMAILKNIFEFAHYEGHPTICSFERLSFKKEAKGMRVLTQQEQRDLQVVLMTGMDRIKLGVLVSLYTGMRIGEICALKWENINTEQKVIKVRATLQRVQDINSQGHTKTKVLISTPKSACSARDIPLPEFLNEILKERREAPDCFLLTGKANQFIEPRTMQNHFKRYVQESHIENVNFHALRHTFATRCVELDFEIKSLSEILGHANVNITLNRYVHPSFDLKMEYMQKLNPVAAK